MYSCRSSTVAVLPLARRHALIDKPTTTAEALWVEGEKGEEEEEEEEKG